jgi:hypothetical protein
MRVGMGLVHVALGVAILILIPYGTADQGPAPSGPPADELVGWVESLLPEPVRAALNEVGGVVCFEVRPVLGEGAAEYRGTYLEKDYADNGIAAGGELQASGGIANGNYGAHIALGVSRSGTC